jgi:protocatechuate 3,4-dioxygenase alpha subunit
MDDPCTPSQTVGPFFSFALADGAVGAHVVDPAFPGAIRVEGSVLDGDGRPVPDALVEIWHANVHGRYAHPADDRDDLELDAGFTGFARCATDDEGRFAFVVVKPGRVPFDGARMQAPHIAVSVFARGLLNRLVTRLYFPDEAEANASDPVLRSLPARARDTLVARATGGGLAFDIRLQGPDQTAFFAL